MLKNKIMRVLVCLLNNKSVYTNSFLLNKTIKDNIVSNEHYLKSDVDEEKFKYIEKLLNLNEVFANFPKKLASNVGYNGEKLSGGQKQILSIARAFYKESKIIILDEPSSALDDDAKIKLSNLLLKIKGTKTILIVTHEVELFNNCVDKIYELNNGVIKEK